MTYTRTWGQMFTRAKPGSAIGLVGEVVGHTEAGADLPASASIAQEIQRVRAIDAYHRSLKWAGFGYSTMVCQSGRVYEGRGYRRSGAHTQGRNTTALAFVVPGHGDRTPMSPACIAAVIRWIGDGVDAGHIRPRPRVSGHRDYTPRKSCPGNRVYPQLAQLANITGASAPPPQEDDELTPEQDKMLREVHRQLTSATKDAATVRTVKDIVEKTNHAVGKSKIGDRNIADDVRRIRLSLRFIGWRMGWPRRYGKDEQTPDRIEA